MQGALSFVGRSSELAALVEAVERARGGAGGLTLLSGEPGIGKSRLAEETARAASERGLHVLWGRCWEAGGAPAYWPWIQVCRALLRQLDGAPLRLPAAQAAHLVRLLPELREHYRDLVEPPALAPEQARFELLDAAARLLLEQAARAPLLLVLEDLHAADASSLLLLDFVARQAPGAPLLLLGTTRDGELERREQLLSLSQRARLLPLRRLDEDAVRAFLVEALGETAAARLGRSVFASTEGNPLFVVEVVRLLSSYGHGVPAGETGALSIPANIQAVIQRRLAALSEPTRGVLQLAAISGRELRLAVLREAFDVAPEALADALAEARAALILLPAEPGRARFSHVLIREVLYRDIEPRERQRLHRLLADAMRGALHAKESTCAEVAHHYLRAGDEARPAAIETLQRAAREAQRANAFDESVVAYERALALCGADGDAHTRFELTLGLGSAMIAAGDAAAGRETCRLALALARALDDSLGVARAVLAIGSIYVFANVDEDLVSLLEEALEALGGERIEQGERDGDGDGDGDDDHDDDHDVTESKNVERRALRARVMARLAAALQPAADPSHPIALAKRAVDLARDVGDQRTLLGVLRAACSTMVDLVDAGARHPYTLEHVALAEALDDRVEVLRGAARLSLEHFELGDRAAAERAMAQHARVAAELSHASYRWRVHAFNATRLLWRGAFAEAEREIEAARALGAEANDRNASATYQLQRARLLYLRGRHDALLAMLPELTAIFEGTPIIDTLGSVYAQAYALRVGGERGSSGSASERERACRIALRLGDRSALMSVAIIARADGDRALARDALQAAERCTQPMFSFGVIGAVWDSPASHARALLCEALGDHDAARSLYEQALRRCSDLEGRALWVEIALDAAQHLVDGGAPARAPVAALLDEARARARELAM
ncbi:MAG: AAA family ATPase, partial [Myxococcales bacterium]|nr:AAA family ATPase [Myxococcales bacterium]